MAKKGRDLNMVRKMQSAQLRASTIEYTVSLPRWAKFEVLKELPQIPESKSDICSICQVVVGYTLFYADQSTQ
jgi:hypothetical protein